MPYRSQPSSPGRRGMPNRHNPQYGTLAQNQAHSTNASHPYDEYPQQGPYSQTSHLLSARTLEPREAAHTSCPQRQQAAVNRTPLFREIELKGPPNIVIFGETGTGKSSLINMLSGEGIAEVSNRAVGCTFQSTPYTVPINERPYTFWDTAGLNEGNSGSVPADEAMHHLRDLVDKLKDGISLLVYCIRGSRYRDIIKVNYDLFTEIICQGEVPVVIIVTGLEVEERMEDWWDASAIEFSNHGMHFRGHACITTSKGKNNVFEAEYEESKQTVRTLIDSCCPHRAWVVDSEQWFNRITERIHEYWEEYNGYAHHSQTRGAGEGKESFIFFGVVALFLFTLIKDAFSSCCL